MRISNRDLNIIIKKNGRMCHMKHIVGFSGGKDSTAILHLPPICDLPREDTILLHFECDWDFPQMVDHLKLVEEKTGLEIVRVRYYRHFNEQLGVFGWPRSNGGWCTACKQMTCQKYIRGVRGPKTEYVGFAADEVHRTETKWVKERKWPICFPLIDLGMNENDALSLCLGLGYDWDGLYDIFDRVSCWNCAKAGNHKRDKIKKHFPELELEWKRLDIIAARAEQGINNRRVRTRRSRQ